MAEEGFKRKLTAILSADAVEYSRLMGEDEEATVRTITAYREVLSTLIQQHNGNVLDSPGDNLLAEFVSVVDAVQCAVAVQKEIKARNDELPENRRMQFRIGINLGDVIQEEERIYGDGVNVAARLESLAEPGGICISRTAFDQIESKLPYGYEFLGDQSVKNIVKPVGAYRVIMEPRITVAKAKDMEASFWLRKGFLVGVVAVLVAIIGVGIWNFYFRASPMEPVSEEDMALPLPDKPSIAVLPFANIGDPEQEYIADGITEQIITALARNPYLFVIASNSTFTYKGKAVKVQQVSRELGVRYVVEGSVQKSGDQIRITAQLIDATKGEHIWAGNYDRDLKDLFALQDEITIEVLKGTMGKLTGHGNQSRTKGTTNIEVYLKVLKAITLVATNEPNNRLGQQILEECIVLDPEFAEVYSRLGMTYTAAILNGWSQSPREDFKKAFELAKKAKGLDQTLVHPHAVLGWIYLQTGKNDEAIAKAEKLLASMGLLEKRDDFPSYLAAGEQQRVAIARSLCMEPKIMLFDDPTSALDPSLVVELVDTLTKLANEGIAMIVVTNEAYLARNVADRVILLDDGVWVEMAPPDELFTNPKKERTRQFLERISLKDISGGV